MRFTVLLAAGAFALAAWASTAAAEQRASAAVEMKPVAEGRHDRLRRKASELRATAHRLHQHGPGAKTLLEKVRSRLKHLERRITRREQAPPRALVD